MSTDTTPHTAPPTTIPAGTIVPYGGPMNSATAIRLEKLGWLFCDGSQVSINEYPALYEAIGTGHGGDAGKGRFNLPDCRGMFIRGVDGARGKDPDASARTAAAPGGNSGNQVGSIQADDFAKHVHGVDHLPGGSHWAVDEAYKYEVAKWNAGSASTAGTGGNETRPRNLYLAFIIRCRND